MTRNELAKNLALLGQLDKAMPTEGFRGYLDKLMGKFLYGGTIVNYRMCKLSVANRIPRSVEVQRMIESGIPKSDMNDFCTLEHRVTIKTLRSLLHKGMIEEVISMYSVCYITREENNVLRAYEKQGLNDEDRYTEAGITLVNV